MPCLLASPYHMLCYASGHSITMPRLMLATYHILWLLVTSPLPCLLIVGPPLACSMFSKDLGLGVNTCVTMLYVLRTSTQPTTLPNIAALPFAVWPSLHNLTTSHWQSTCKHPPRQRHPSLPPLAELPSLNIID